MYNRHSLKRIRGRLGLPKKSADKEIEKVLKFGMFPSAFTGKLRSYLEKHENKSLISGRYILVFGNKVFIFHNDELITTWQLPRRFIVKRSREYETSVEEVSEISREEE